MCNLFYRMDRDHPGVVFVKQYANDPEKKLNLLKKNVREFRLMDPEMPSIIPTKGLDAARQWYLYTDISPFCQNKEACPLPQVPKPENINIDDTDVDSKRKCGHCKMTGHTKSRKGKITCPSLLGQR